MSDIRIRFFIAFLVLFTGNLFLHGQIVGESQATSIRLVKPGTEAENQRILNDVLPPSIKIISPLVDTTSTAHTHASEVYVIGKLTDESKIQSVSINGRTVPADENGFFHLLFELEDGVNVLKIDASDVRANSSTRFLHLIKQTTPETPAGDEDISLPGDYYGLIIGINDYKDPSLLDLDHPVNDATLVYSTLIGNYTFSPENVTLLKNPGRAEIIQALDALSQNLTKNDNLLIFYAGHGIWDDKKETGFWLPADAEKSSSVNWIRNSTIQDYVDDIQTHHTLLISDACFAGSIFKTRGAFQDASVAINKLYAATSRKAMTSGNLKQVPDKSVFLEFLVKRLYENEKKYISTSELFNSFREAVLNNSPNIPLYGVIQDTGDEGGDFIFIKRY